MSHDTEIVLREYYPYSPYIPDYRLPPDPAEKEEERRSATTAIIVVMSLWKYIDFSAPIKTLSNPSFYLASPESAPGARCIAAGTLPEE